MKFNKLTIPFIVILIVVSTVLSNVLSRSGIPQWEANGLATFIAVLVAMPLLNRNK
jgi:hypothetical protein